MQKNPVIGIVMATMLEAKPFVVETPMKRIEKHPFKVYAKDDIYLVLTGIGKANAAMGTFYCCQRFSPAPSWESAKMMIVLTSFPSR